MVLAKGIPNKFNPKPIAMFLGSLLGVIEYIACFLCSSKVSISSGVKSLRFLYSRLFK
tara:strand:+ start:41 stop:214 length:174 start_codon:yes stop_codon:yes gene_type:complete